MNIDSMNGHTGYFLTNCRVLAARKNRDYHPDNVAMLEILETAFESHMTVEQDLWGRIQKQRSALKRFLFDGAVESEPPTQRMMDIVNYMAILNFWIEYKNTCVADAMHFVSESRHCERIISLGSDCFMHRHLEPCDRCAFLNWLHILATTGKYGDRDASSSQQTRSQSPR